MGGENPYGIVAFYNIGINKAFGCFKGDAFGTDNGVFGKDDTALMIVIVAAIVFREAMIGKTIREQANIISCWIGIVGMVKLLHANHIGIEFLNSEGQIGTHLLFGSFAFGMTVKTLHVQLMMRKLPAGFVFENPSFMLPANITCIC